MTERCLLSLLVLFTATFSWGQSDSAYLLWSASRKLTVDDFAIKARQLESTPSVAQFSVDYQLNGFDFLAKNFNKKVRNYFIKTASWIDTSAHVQQSLTYQQTLFDISEIYTRQFRKALKENRKQIAKGTAIAETLNKQIMAAFARRRLDYDRETNFGANAVKQKEWEQQVQKELAALADYAYDK